MLIVTVVFAYDPEAADSVAGAAGSMAVSGDAAAGGGEAEKPGQTRSALEQSDSVEPSGSTPVADGGDRASVDGERPP